MTDYETIRAKLRNAYMGIMAQKAGEPDWAVKKISEPQKLVSCTIPFVGKEYSCQSTKILVYASAENLTYYKECTDILDNDDVAIDRHRYRFDCSCNKDKFFSNVHLAPISDGCLSTAVYYLATQYLGFAKSIPKEFYEKIAFGNCGKYSQAGTPNKDYASRQDLMKESYAFIAKDIEILSPDYLVLPNTIYKKNKSFFDKFKGRIKFIPIFQLNARVINTHIACEKSARKYIPPEIQEWYDNLSNAGIKGKTYENYLHVFTYLDEIYNEMMVEKEKI